MNTYLLFLHGLFETPADLNEFSNEFVSNISSKSAKFIIESQFNVIVVFDSDLEDEEMAQEIKSKLIDKHVKFYFLFNREALMIANIPQEISAIIFKDLPKNSSLEIKLLNNTDIDKPNIKYDNEIYVDALLDKIKNFGKESLTKFEKEYLDNFKK